MGKRRDAKLAAMIGSEIAKAGLGGTPMAMSGATPANVTMEVSPRTMPSLAQALARNYDTFGSQMGPNYPLVPMTIDSLGPNGRPEPRKYQYDISENLQVSKQLAKWNILRAAAEQCDVVARMITIRTSEVAKMSKSWIITDEAIQAVKDREGVGSAEASSICRQENVAQIARLNEFWDNPYPQSDRGWREWIVEAIWQIMVYDGLAVHPAMNLGRQTIGFNIIDASTIKCLLNNYGDTPRPPDPAYQQILYGFPRGEFTATPDKDAKFFADGQFSTSMRDQLSYFVMNRRTWTPYGFSPVEQAIPLVNIYLEYTKMMLFEFKHGTSSDVYIKTTGNELTLDSYARWDRIFDDFMEGDTANRKKTRTLPDGFDPVFAPSVEERFKPDYIESVIKRMAGIFGVSSQQLGVIPHAGMGGGKGAQEGDQDNAETVSVRPMMNFIKEFVNSLSRRYLGATSDVTFVLQDDFGSMDDVMIANAAKITVESGLMTLNEQRRELGKDDFDFDGADEPFIVAGNTIVYLRGQFSTQQGANSEAQSTPSAQDAQTQEAQGDESSQGVGESGKTQAQLKTAEAQAFRKFAQKPRSRDFVFKYHNADEAQTLKAQIIDTPKGLITKQRSSNDLPSFAALAAAAKKHAPKIAKAIKDGFSGIPEAIAAVLGHEAAQVDPVVVPTIVRAAMKAHVSFDSTSAIKEMGQLYNSVVPIVRTEAAAIFNGGEASKSIEQLLAQREITLKGISDSATKRISDAISNGVANAQSHADISSAVNAIIADPRRSEVIAQTETNRAFNQTFLDQMQAAGIAQWEWLADASACPECLGQAGLHDYGAGQPPEHPNCNCQVVVPDSTSTDVAT